MEISLNEQDLYELVYIQKYSDLVLKQFST